MKTSSWADFCFRSKLACAYQVAKRHVLEAGFHHEIEWQAKRELSCVSEETFLREAAWVIFSSGMRESVIRKRFADLEAAFLNFRSASLMHSNRKLCRLQALRCFNHRGKVSAVLDIASHVAEVGFEKVVEGLQTEPIDYLSQFPYLGPATARHLAKNLGVKTAKPDRHLQRVSSLFGYRSPDVMCSAIASIVSDDVSVIDVVIWRFATLDKNYLEFFGLVFSNETLPEPTKFRHAYAP
jgi:hypothetical protein